MAEPGQGGAPSIVPLVTGTASRSTYARGFAAHRIVLTGSRSVIAFALLLVAGAVLVTWSPWSRDASPFRFFAATSFWNRALPDVMPLEPHSGALLAHLSSEVSQESVAGSGPNINTVTFSVPVYTVANDQPLVPVKLDHGPEAALSAAWSAVPLPLNAHPADGSDGSLVVWQPRTDKLWEFWQLHRAADGWHATWGGAIGHVKSSDGIFGPNAWPGARNYWGAAATSLPLVGGLMTIDELKRGEIDHALALAIPDPRAKVWSSPAQRTDGQSGDPTSLPEGTRLRLDPHLNLGALHLPPMTLTMARAAQRYGVVVRDTSGVISFYAEDPVPTGIDPYYGPKGIFGGLNPRQLLALFPWKHLQVLKLDLHGP